MVAAEQADIVGVNTSLASGEKGGDLASQATFDHYDRCLTWIREAAPDRFESIELQMMAFATRIVTSRRAAARTATMLGLPGEDALELPIVLIGTVEELCKRLLEYRTKWGFSNIVVSGDAMESFAPVVAQLAGT